MDTFVPVESTGPKIIRSRVDYHTLPEQRLVSIAVDHGQTGGSQDVPYLEWARREDGGLSLILDSRLMVMLPVSLAPHEVDEIVEFIANAIAVGGGYPSIYYLDRKMPFRG
jgi:hypothetical protein